MTLTRKLETLSIGILMIIASCPVMAGHTIYLKSGDNLKGEFAGGNKDTIVFNFMGNLLSLPTQQVNAIYFDEQVAPKSITDPYGERDAKITGYINDVYLRHNVKQGDNGAQVWMVNEKDLINFNGKLITDTFKTINNVRDMYKQFEDAGVPVPDNVKAVMVLYNADTDAKFEEYCRRTNKEISKIKSNKKALRFTCDIDGKFYSPVPSGTYYILVVSNNDKGSSSVEAGGRIVCKKVTILPQDDYIETLEIEIP